MFDLTKIRLIRFLLIHCKISHTTSSFCWEILKKASTCAKLDLSISDSSVFTCININMSFIYKQPKTFQESLPRCTHVSVLKKYRTKSHFMKSQVAFTVMIHKNTLFWVYNILCRLSTQEPASIAFDHEQGDLSYSEGPYKNKKGTGNLKKMNLNGPGR